MAPISTRPYRGVFPVAPTIFDDRGELDLDGQRRCIDFMIDAGSARPLHPGEFLRAVRADRRRARAGDGRGAEACRRPRAGDRDDDAFQLARSAPSAAARPRQAGAAMVMIMPPYHGATFRVSETAIFDFFRVVSDAIDIPIMIQDAPVGGHAALGRPCWPGWRGRSRTSAISRSRCRMAAAKLRDLIAAGGDAIVGPWDGEEAHHPDGRPRCRRHRRHDRRRLSRTASGRSWTPISPGDGRRRRRRMRAGCR